MSEFKNDDLARLRGLLEEGYRIIGTHISIEPKIEKDVAEVTLRKRRERTHSNIVSEGVFLACCSPIQHTTSK